MSHPSWVRGLKLLYLIRKAWQKSVAPLVGAWIETHRCGYDCIYIGVAPLVGAWIETSKKSDVIRHLLSHPSWVRGLKLLCKYSQTKMAGRTPRGCVD